jgi:hypothetical protein
MRKLALAAAAGLGLLAALAAALVLTAEFWMVRWLDGVLAQPGLVEGRHGAVRYSLWRGHLEIDDLTVVTEVPVGRSYRAAHVAADGIGAPFLFDLARGKPVLRLAALEARQVAADVEGLKARCATLELADLAYDQSEPPAAQPPVFFRRLHLSSLALEDAETGATLANGVLTMEGALGAASAANVTLGDVVITPKAPGAARLGRMTLDLDGQVTLDAAEKRLAVRQHLLWRAGGTLDLSLRLGGVSASLIGEDRIAVAAGLAAAWLEGLELRYEDASGLARVLDVVASLRGEPVEALRADLIAALEARRPLVAKKPGLAASLDALERFLREGGALTLTAAPLLRVPFAGLALAGARDPTRVAELLGLSIR